MRLRWLAGQFAKPRGVVGRFVIGPWLDRIAGPMNRLVLEQLDLRPGETFLEVGFGGGGLMHAAIDAGARALGADPSPEMVARARRRFASRAEVVAAPVEALPFPNESADAAASVNNIYFWTDPAAAMAELARVVRPGGRLAIAFEPPEELAKWPGHRFGFRSRAEGEVRALMEGAGFRGIEAAWGRGRRPDRFLCLTGKRCGGDAL